jgi:hypothetical protein
MKKLLLSFIILTSVFTVHGQISSETQEEKEIEVLNYSNIKNVLINDGLATQKEKKQQIVKSIKKERKNLYVERYNYPTEEDFYAFVSELWLVKNAQLLNWDYPKPSYGIEKAFKKLLEKMGFYNIHFKILLINSPALVHFGLPSKKNEYIFLLSIPFMRSLDLTKVDISLLLLEDFLRLQNKDFIMNLKLNKSLFGTNFYENKIDKKLIEKVLKSYSENIFKIGFSFHQQFEITKKMESFLKSDPALWGAYFRMIQKIDRFIKSDLLYKDYLKIYPSPELQIQWLSPKKKVI